MDNKIQGPSEADFAAAAKSFEETLAKRMTHVSELGAQAVVEKIEGAIRLIDHSKQARFSGAHVIADGLLETARDELLELLGVPDEPG